LHTDVCRGFKFDGGRGKCEQRGFTRFLKKKTT